MARQTGRTSIPRRLAALVALAVLTALPAAAQDNPDTGRGFQADKVYQFGQIDSVNLFNGNLTLALPLGGTFPVNGDLSYALALTYNSNIWRFNGYQWWQPGGGIISSQVASLEKTNAGPGWRLTLGDLQDAAYPENDGTQWVYVARDGARHAFYDTLHTGETATSGVSYSRDGSYLRLVRESNTAYRVEFPDGSKHRFMRSSPFTSSPFQLDYQEDVYGNRLTVSYPSSLHWTLSDGHRTHDVYFKNLSIDGATWTVVDRVELSAFGGTTATYSFGYTQQAVEESGFDDYSGNSYYRNAYLLTSVGLPDGSSWGMTYYTTRTSGSSSSENQGGVIQRLTLPTLGSYEWTYQDYDFPNRVAPGQAGSGTLSLAHSTGVSTKRLLNASGQCESHGSGSSTDPSVGCQWTYRWTQRLGTFWDRWTVVTFPTGDETAYYFDERPRPDTSTYVGWEYGLPFTKAANDGQGRYLSQRIYDGGVGVGTLVREVYVSYERDKVPTGGSYLDPHFWENTNRRQLSRRVLYKDDGTHYRQQDWSDFDGLGHYRSEQASGSLPGGGTRTMRREYNDGRGSYTVNLSANSVTGGYQPWPTGSPWVLGTSTEARVTENGSTAVNELCYEASTGFLLRQRTYKGTSRGTQDVITVAERNSLGNLTRQRYYGGDNQTVSTAANLCSLAVPSTDVYSQRFAYSYGALSSTTWRTTSDGQFLQTLSRTVDDDTGLASRDYDVSGLYVDYEYDVQGRLTLVKPQSGHGGRTRYVYTRATSAANTAQVEVQSQTNTGSSILARQRFVFDPLGRLWRDQRLEADGQWSSVDTVYNAMDWKRSVSERQTGYPNALTVYKDYDPFGRPHRVEPPDNPDHRLLFWYTGERIMQREVQVCGTSGGCPSVSQETKHNLTERYDRHGRLYQVVEPSGPSGADVTTTYSYDVGNRLSQVSTSAEGVTQTRLFNYDRRGFLQSERHPEKGASGNGYVTYSNYDPLGNAGRKIDGPYDLRFSYDRAARPTQVQELSGGSLRPTKVFTYATSNYGSDRRAGKLWRADRYNYVTLGTTPFTVQVRQTYAYAGIGATVSQRDTQMWVNGGAAESFTQGFTWNNLGDVASLSYPQCTHSGCTATSPRTVSFGYTNGFLTSVPGYASLLRYHPNGMVWQVLHANGVTDTVALDASGMARPASISTSGANSNWSTGSYRYDGAGNVSQMGSGTYTYDGVSRLTRAVTFVGQTGSGTGYVRTYDYDSYGNLESIAGSGGRTLAVNHGTNRLTGSVVYDSAGNMTYRNGTSYYYDSSGMLWKQVAPAGDERLYFYDVDDERFWSYHWSGSDWALRDLDGKVLRLYHSGTGGWSVTRDYVYRGGRLLAGVEPGVTTYHYSLDHLGSPRLITNGSGNKTAFHVYHPYGEEVPFWNQDSERMKFTGHEREFGDTSGPGDDLDYMHARYYGLGVARFLSFDPVGGNPRSGQSWNRYAYVLGNPLRFVDPLGLKEGSPCTSEDGKITCDGGSVDAGNNLDPLKEGGRSMDQASFGNFLFGAHAGGSRRSSYGEQQAASGLSVSQFANYIAANGGTGECDFACQVMRGVAADSLTGTVYLEKGVLTITNVWLLSPAGAFSIFSSSAPPALFVAEYELSGHAVGRALERGLTLGTLRNAVSPANGFRYFHEGAWKYGYYEAESGVFLGTVDDTVTTVFKASKNYIQNLKAATP